MLEVAITLEYSNAKTADAIAKAVSPDNFKKPKELFIETVRKGGRVLTEIKTTGNLATFIATIDDLLSCVSTAERTLAAVTKTRLE